LLPKTPPAWIANLLLRIVGQLGKLRRAIMPAQFAATELGVMSWVSISIGALVELGIPDALAKKRKSADEVARECGLHAASLYRLMRLAASFDVLHEDRDGRFALTRIGRTLGTNAAGSAAGTVRYANAPWHVGAYARLADAVRTGEPAFDLAYGLPLFSYLAQQPQAAALFDAGMEAVVQLHASAVLAAYDFSSIAHLVDVGGSNGLLLAAILARYSAMRGTLFDLPRVVEGAPPVFESAKVSDRVAIAGGDFFEGIPTGGDAYLASHVLHDWADAPALAILRNAHLAMSEGARLLIVEIVLPARGDNHFSQGKITDVEMMTMLTGRERTRDEFEQLLQSAGLRIVRIVPTAAPESVIEAVRR
jgi:hypothetical protein